MTPERLDTIREMFADSECYERGDWLDAAGELLAEVDRLRGAADGLDSWLGTRRDDTLARSDGLARESGTTEYQFHGGQGMAFNEAKIKGRELGLWA